VRKFFFWGISPQSGRHPERGTSSSSTAQRKKLLDKSLSASLFIEVSMKQALFILLAVAFLMGCGGGLSDLTIITFSRHSHTDNSYPKVHLGYSAMGIFLNGKSRELSQVDGLSWKTSPTATGSVAATIGSTGEVTCSAPGTVTITASAPQNLQFTVNNGVQNTSATVRGTATLICE
jgi:hypothetical protein